MKPKDLLYLAFIALLAGSLGGVLGWGLRDATKCDIHVDTLQLVRLDSNHVQQIIRTSKP